MTAAEKEGEMTARETRSKQKRTRKNPLKNPLELQGSAYRVLRSPLKAKVWEIVVRIVITGEKSRERTQQNIQKEKEIVKMKEGCEILPLSSSIVNWLLKEKLNGE